MFCVFRGIFFIAPNRDFPKGNFGMLSTEKPAATKPCLRQVDQLFSNTQGELPLGPLKELNKITEKFGDLFKGLRKKENETRMHFFFSLLFFFFTSAILVPAITSTQKQTMSIMHGSSYPSTVFIVTSPPPPPPNTHMCARMS